MVLGQTWLLQRSEEAQGSVEILAVVGRRAVARVYMGFPVSPREDADNLVEKKQRDSCRVSRDVEIYGTPCFVRGSEGKASISSK